MAKRPLRMPDRSEFTDDTPLRLAVAAALAFPGGGMTASGLRKERDAGRLVTELVAGKEFTTLADIGRMREMCRRKVEPQRPIQSPQPSAASQEERSKIASAAAMLAVERLKAKTDARRKIERVARQKESEAARAARRIRVGEAAPKQKG